jgi:hypothetical protein
MIWRYSLSGFSSEPVADLANYLNERGFFADGRFLLAEAKEMDYLPNLSCTYGDFWSCQNSRLLYYGLWPSQWGARPEYSFYCLLVLLSISCAASVIYWKFRGAGKQSDALLGSSAQSSADALNEELNRETKTMGLGDRRAVFDFDGSNTAEGEEMEKRSREGLEKSKVRSWSTPVLYGADVALPAVNLGYYGKLEPPDALARFAVAFIHMLAWYFGTLFIASITIL